MTTFTVVLPHRRNHGNDDALRICLDCLYANTVNDFKLIVDAAADQPLYERVNRMVAQSDTDACVYLASDTFVAPSWDVPMLASYTPSTFVTGVLVEPNMIGVHPNNVNRDFGRTPATFRRAEFEQWVLSGGAGEMADNEGWYCPTMFPRDGYLAHGGLSTEISGHPTDFSGADVLLYERWKAAGNVIRRVPSYAYHLQRWSDIGEQSRGERYE